ncbi:MAG: hypothetical protein Q8O67_19035 [Deltaproteobacteria bacterium]|nr:hypothetical protein [Deltaproteobacteria bacterium]
MFDPPAFVPTGVDVVLSWTTPTTDEDCGLFIGNNALTSLGRTSAAFSVDVVAPIGLELRCPGRADLERTIQTWETSDHAVAATGIATWTTDPSNLVTECDTVFSPRGILSSAQNFTTQSAAVIAVPTESTDVAFDACRIVGSSDPEEPLTGEVALVVAPVIARFEAVDVTSAPSVVLEVEVSGADRCSITGVVAVEVLRTDAAQRVFVFEFQGVDTNAAMQATCELGDEGGVSSATTVNVLRANVNADQDGLFLEPGPSVLLGNIDITVFSGNPTFPSLKLISGNVTIDRNQNAGTCLTSAIVISPTFANLTMLNGNLSILDNFVEVNVPGAFCPGGLNVVMPDLVELRGTALMVNTRLADGFELPSLRAIGGGLGIQDVSTGAGAGDGGFEFLALETLGGELSINAHDADRVLFPVLTDIGDRLNFEIWTNSNIDEITFPALAQVGGEIRIRNLAFVDTIQLGALRSADAIDFTDNLLLTDIDLSLLTALGTGGSDGFKMDSNAGSAVAGSLTVLLPVAPVVVQGSVTITNNRRTSQIEAQAIAAHFDNTGFPTPVVTGNAN